jgi:glucose/mannose-6-phosphate isomerase
MGGSGIAGDVLSAVAGPSCPVPVLTHRGYGLPAWVGPVDLVIVVSCSGSTEETLSALEEAVRRGCRLMVVGRAGSPRTTSASAAARSSSGHAQGRQPRRLWALSRRWSSRPRARPAAGAASGRGGGRALEDVAPLPVDAATWSTRPSAGQQLTGAAAGCGGPAALAGAAYRFACQLNENAKTPGTWGVLPEANHNQVVAVRRPVRRGRRSARRRRLLPRPGDDDGRRLGLVLLRDSDEHPQVAPRAT